MPAPHARRNRSAATPDPRTSAPGPIPAVDKLTDAAGRGAPPTVWAPPPDAAGPAVGEPGSRPRSDARSCPRAARRLFDLTEHLTAGPMTGTTRGPADAGRAANTAAHGTPGHPVLGDAARRRTALGSRASQRPRPATDPATQLLRASPPRCPAPDRMLCADADLVVVDLGAAHADDRLGVLAARALRGGGILAVLTNPRLL